MARRSPTNTLGRTGLQVTRLAFGAMEVRGPPRGRPATDDQVRNILTAVLDAGINYLDTSNDYGRSEEFIGTFLAARRSDYFLASKCGCVPGGGEHVWTRHNLFRGLHESLDRLRTDYLDVMQLHGPSVEDTERGGLVEALEDMRAQGKVRWIGVSTTLPNLPTYLESGAFDVFQIPYSALQRDHESLIADAARAGIGTVIRGGVAKGEPGEGLGTSEVWGDFERAELDELRADGESRTAFMLRFTYTHPGIHAIIVGTLRPEHLAQNLEAIGRGPLPAETYEEAKRRLDAVGVTPVIAG